MHFGWFDSAHHKHAQCKQKGSPRFARVEAGFAHMFALVGVLVLAAVAGEVYYFAKVKPVKIVQTTQNTSVASNQGPDKQESTGNGFLQIPKITTAEQQKFNDYSSKDLGIGFNYAKDLIVKTDSEEEYNKRGNGDFRKNFKGYVGYEPGKFVGAIAVLDETNSFDKSPFTVWVFDNPDNLTPEAWFDKYWYYPFLWGVFDWTSKGHVTPDKEATISGKAGKYKIVSYQPDSPKYVYLSNSGKIYLLRVIGEKGDQILSSFKFLN